MKSQSQSHKDNGRKNKDYIVMEKDDLGYNMLTEDFLIELCKVNGQYENPKLNDNLFLQYKGFKKIQALDKYINLKALWIDCNGIEKLEGLDG